METNDLSYAAGILDGEGCILIADRGSGRGFQLQVVVVNTNLPLLNWLQERWGGSIHAVKLDGRAVNPKPCSRWQVVARKAGSFLCSVRPYMLVKRDQADNAIAFQSSRGKGGYAGRGYIDLDLETGEARPDGTTFAAEAKRLKVV